MASCYAEQTFSALRRHKTELRSTMGEDSNFSCTHENELQHGCYKASDVVNDVSKSTPVVYFRPRMKNRPNPISMLKFMRLSY